MTTVNLKNINDTTKEVALLPRKTLTQLINETDESIYYALKNSVYPGAKDESIAMVLAACKARDYPPLSKCFHIVPMSVKNAQTGDHEWRDVIMPGITLYRIEADRSKNYLGLSEPIFGPMIKEKMGGVDVEYPEWCKIVASKKLSNGEKADFPVIEYWKENYATKGKDSSAPNAMWFKRPRGQLAKCTEAQALRRLYPDILGGNTTFEEMEDKGYIKNVDGFVVKPLEIEMDNRNQVISAEQLNILSHKISLYNSDEAAFCKLANIKKLEDLEAHRFEKAEQMLDKKIREKKTSDSFKEMAANKQPVVTQQEVADFIAELGDVDVSTGEINEV